MSSSWTGSSPVGQKGTGVSQSCRKSGVGGLPKPKVSRSGKLKSCVSIVSSVSLDVFHYHKRGTATAALARTSFGMRSFSITPPSLPPLLMKNKGCKMQQGIHAGKVRSHQPVQVIRLHGRIRRVQMGMQLQTRANGKQHNVGAAR